MSSPQSNADIGIYFLLLSPSCKSARLTRKELGAEFLALPLVAVILWEWFDFCQNQFPVLFDEGGATVVGSQGVK